MKKTQKTSINNSLCSILITSTGNNIGEAGATSLSESLKTNTTLTELYMDCDDKNTQRAYTNKQITFFFFFTALTGNDIGNTGTTSLSEALKSNTTLTKLSLRSEDKRKKTHKRHPSTIHSFPFSSYKQMTGLETPEQRH